MLVRFSFKTIVIVLITDALTVLGAINSVQKAKYVTPDDGCGWISTSRGVEAFIVEQNGPGERAGVQKGDVLETINDKRVSRATDVTRELYNLGIWSKANYTILRAGTRINATLIITPQDTRLRFKRFLEVVGFLYLMIGIFIFLRRWQAAGALHFYIICLTSFVVYSYSFTNKLNGFDWTIYWLDAVCFLLLPPLFLHFCLTFPERKEFLRRHSILRFVLYWPAAFLLAVHFLFIRCYLNVLQS